MLVKYCKIFYGYCYFAINIINNGLCGFWKYIKFKNDSSFTQNYALRLAVRRKSLSKLQIFLRLIFKKHILYPLCHLWFFPFSSAFENGHVIILEYDVLGKLSDLRMTWSCGPDGIPPSFLRQYAQSLSEPLMFIFDRPLHLGVFPDYCKSSVTRRKSDAKDYRNINV